MTTQTRPQTPIERCYAETRQYHKLAGDSLARCQRATEALRRDQWAAEATVDAMYCGAYRREADRLPLPPESDGPAYVQACAQLADIRIWAEEAGKLAGLALEAAAQVQP